MKIWPKGMDDLLDESDTAYCPLDSLDYAAEKELLEFYRNFVSEMLRMSLAGVAVIGFLAKFLKDGHIFTICTKVFGFISMSSFALSSILALIFLYASAEGYRYYLSGLRSKLCNSKHPPDEYLAKRKEFLAMCIWSKAGSAIFLSVGAIFACIAIILIISE